MQCSHHTSLICDVPGATVCKIEIPILWVQNTYWRRHKVELQATITRTAIINQNSFVIFPTAMEVWLTLWMPIWLHFSVSLAATFGHVQSKMWVEECNALGLGLRTMSFTPLHFFFSTVWNLTIAAAELWPWSSWQWPWGQHRNKMEKPWVPSCHLVEFHTDYFVWEKCTSVQFLAQLL